MRGRQRYQMSRRAVLQGFGMAIAGCAKPSIPAAARSTGLVTHDGIQIGDVTASSAVVWSRARSPGDLIVEVNGRIVRGSRASADTDFTAKALLTELPPGRVAFRARFDDGAPMEGSFVTAPLALRPIRIAFSGDTNGQGYGVDLARGGMPAYAALEHEEPELFIHLGDTIYADYPIGPTIECPDGSIWTNLVDPEKEHPAETLADYRANHRYPRLSAEVRSCSARVPIAAIWDDHEVRNNWFPTEVIGPADQAIEKNRYTERRIDVLAAFAKRAFFEYQPTLSPMNRVMRWGPLADIFLLDGRSYRTPNDPPPDPGRMLGAEQADWLVRELRSSRAKWKIVASNMPIGLVIGEPARIARWAADGWGNEDNGMPREREVEIARILTAVRGVKNIVWLGADVHYAAAHRFDPVRAAYKDFDSFWELVAGPMHATAFGRKSLDQTFGPELEWCSVDWDERGSPADGKQWFGVLEIDPANPNLRVKWVNARGEVAHRLTIPAL